MAKVIATKPSPVEGTDSRRSEGMTFVIPAFNEEAAIGQIVAELAELIGSLGREVQILVIDDGSSDRTASVSASIPGVEVIRHPRNRGYGAALKTGIQHANHDLVMIMDGDGTYSPLDASVLIENFEKEKADMVVGARTGTNASISWVRRPAKWAITRLASYVAGTPIPDVNSGMRLFRASLVRKILHLLPDGFSFTTTLTLALLMNGYLIDHAVIRYGKRYGRSKIRPIADTLGFIQLILRLALLFAPMKIFLPMAGALLCLAAVWAFATWRFAGRLADASTAVIAMTGVQIGVLGLLAELINSRVPKVDEPSEKDLGKPG